MEFTFYSEDQIEQPLVLTWGPEREFVSMLLTVAGGQNWDCRIWLKDQERIVPGGTYVRGIHFLRPDEAPAALNGITFGLWAGRTIGEGRLVDAPGPMISS